VLRVLGDPARQFRTGGLGTGHAMKALNNAIGADQSAEHLPGGITALGAHSDRLYPAKRNKSLQVRRYGRLRNSSVS
jgi:hypothetical protein